jgi:hypothetical protein
MPNRSRPAFGFLLAELVARLGPEHGKVGDAAVVASIRVFLSKIAHEPPSHGWRGDQMSGLHRASRQIAAALAAWSACRRPGFHPASADTLTRPLLIQLFSAEQNLAAIATRTRTVARLFPRFDRSAPISPAASLLHAAHVPLFLWTSALRMTAQHPADAPKNKMAELLDVWLKRRIVFRGLLDRDGYAEPLSPAFIASPLAELPFHCLVDIHAYAAPLCEIYEETW